MATRRKSSHRASTQQLPLSASADVASRSAAPTEGLLATNHLNLLFSLSIGMVPDPSGFGKKYYRDSLETCPGWVPLFVRRAFGPAIELAQEEASHLRPCLARIRLTTLSGPVMALRDGKVIRINFPGESNGSDEVILVPVPLPTHWIEEIIFSSKEDKAACEVDARDYSNVPLLDFKRAVRKREFTGAKRSSWPPPADIEERDADFAVPLAAGGIMAMLYQVANRGDLAVSVCAAAFDPDSASETVARDSLLARLPEWQRVGGRLVDEKPIPAAPDTAEVRMWQRQLFWGIVRRLAQANSGQESIGSKEAVLEQLGEGSEGLSDKVKQKVLDFKGALEGLAGFGSIGPREMFERYPTPFSRSLALLFLREDCDGLLAYEDDILTERDWLAAAILFGARSGWQDRPLALGDMPGLTPAVSHRMAALAHRTAESGISLGPSVERCRPLRELFQMEAEWTPRHRDAAAELARKRGWDCVRTEIVLPTGQYDLIVERKGIRIVMPGQDPPVVTKVDREGFFKHLARDRTSGELEALARKRLGSGTKNS